MSLNFSLNPKTRQIFSKLCKVNFFANQSGFFKNYLFKKYFLEEEEKNSIHSENILNLPKTEIGQGI